MKKCANATVIHVYQIPKKNTILTCIDVLRYLLKKGSLINSFSKSVISFLFGFDDTNVLA